MNGTLFHLSKLNGHFAKVNLEIRWPQKVWISTSKLFNIYISNKVIVCLPTCRITAGKLHFGHLKEPEDRKH